MPDGDTIWSFRPLTTWGQALAPELRDEWATCCRADIHENVFFTPELVRAWLDTYRRLHRLEPYFVIGGACGGAWAILPLVVVHGRWKEGWSRVLLPVGFNEYDYHDPALVPGDEGTAARFWPDFLEWLSLAQAGADALIIPRLRHGGEGCLPNVQASGAGVAPWIDISRAHSLADLTRGRPKSVRSDLGRQQRRLNAVGPLSLRTFAPAELEASLAALPHLVATHRAAWPRAYRAPGLLERIVRLGLPTGVVNFSCLFVGDQPVSWHLGFRHERRFFWYLPAYDPEFAAFSPGKVHLGLLVEAAVASGCGVFDLLVGDEAYKREWTDQRGPLISLESRAAGLIPRGRMAARAWLKSAAATRASFRKARAS